MDRKTVDTTAANHYEIVQKMISLGRFHAMREGVPQVELEDCEVTFVERMLLRGVARGSAGSGLSDSWLHRCAQNHARNYRRHLNRRQGQCVSLHTLREQWVTEQDAVEKQSPETVFIRKDLQISIGHIVQRLIPEVRSMLLSHYVMGRTAAEIATTSGKSPHAVEQALYRARNVMRKELRREGVEQVRVG